MSKNKTEAISLLRILGDHTSTNNPSLDNANSSNSNQTSSSLERQNGISNFGAVMHVIKGNIGPGILAMPAAFSHAGILFGTVMLAVLGVICVHCMHLLVKCSHYLCRKTKASHLDYSGVAEVAINFLPAATPRKAKAGRVMVNIYLVLAQFGFCCVYVLFIARNIKLVVEKCIGNEPDSINYRINYPMSLQHYELVLVTLLVAIVFIRDVKYLAPFSMLANIAALVALGIILYYILIHQKFQSVSRLPLIKDWSELPLYFSTALYAFEGIGVILPIENKMKEPQAFPSLFGVLNLGMTIVCVLFITVGFYGYIEFGDEAMASVTLNLKSWYGVAVQILFSLCIYVSYAVQFYVPLTIIGPAIAESKLAQFIGPTLFDYITRLLLVLLTVGVAAAVDEYLDLLIALIGSVTSTVLAIILPALLEIATFWPDRKERKYYWIMFTKDIFIIVFGTLCFALGTYVAMQQLVQKLTFNFN